MRLLFVTATVLSVFLSLAMIFFKVRQRKYPGFGKWTLGACLISIGYLLYALRGKIPDFLSIVIGSVTFPVGLVLYLDGIVDFAGLPPMSPLWYAMPVLSLGANSYFLYVYDNPPIRALLGGIVLAVPHLETARIVFRESFKEKLLFYPVLAVELTAASMLFLVRGVWALYVPSYNILLETPFQVGFFISMIVFQITITISFIMLGGERMERQLTASEVTLTTKVGELEQALSQVKTLSGLLPICASCKRIHDDKDNWVPIENYIRDRSHADFTHGVCPECAERLYPGLWK